MFVSHAKSVNEGTWGPDDGTLWDLGPSSSLSPSPSVLGSEVPVLYRRGELIKECTRTSKKGRNAPWEDAGQGPADAGKRDWEQATMHGSRDRGSAGQSSPTPTASPWAHLTSLILQMGKEMACTRSHSQKTVSWGPKTVKIGLLCLDGKH